ncbi:MAG TPA: cytochrome c [Gemmatimonadales bacterium]|jgi:mono/diheme cytochrome c family protein|nr:cytochrome c [Gemmatimonadales bacterium]
MLAALALFAAPMVGCAKGEHEEKAGGEKTEAAESHEEGGEGLTAFQLKNGIGPITEEVKVGPVDKALAAQGEKLFTAKGCTACHKIGEKYVGPALGGVTERRTPTYVMNMILNPVEMYEKHPVARGLLAEFMTQMPNLNLTKDEARAIMEYLRTQGPATAAAR